MDNLDQGLLSALSSQLSGAGHLYVAYSGGMDSSVLLHALAAAVPRQKITAIHVDHGLSPRSREWAQHCSETCARLGVEFRAEHVHVAAGGKGVEQAARLARYRIFEQLLGAGDILLMAHHLDDQVETLLYRMLRGSGPKGLAGIPQSRCLGKGLLLRPFIKIPRAVLLEYATAHGLAWVDDESNAATDFDRNYLRHEVVPPLASRWSDYRQRLWRTVAQCQSAAAALSELALMDLAMTGEQAETLGHSICLETFSKLSRPRQLNLIREWALIRHCGQPGHTVPVEVLESLIPAREDGAPRVVWQGGEFRRFRQRLYLLPCLAEQPGVAGLLSVALASTLEPIALPDGTILQPSRGRGKQALAIRPGDKLAVGFRQGGERCAPAGRGGSASLKKLLNEYQVEPWLRYRLPLVHRNGELAAVAGLFVCRDFCCDEHEEGVIFHWQCPAPAFLSQK